MDWISTKDRLPKEGDGILLFIDKEVYVGYRIDGEKHWHIPNLNWVTISTGHCFECGNADEISDDKVTHWMPLPKPPEKA